MPDRTWRRVHRLTSAPVGLFGIMSVYAVERRQAPNHEAMALVSHESDMTLSTQSWREVLLALKARGLKAPNLAIGDGAMGYWAALEEAFPATRQQRCWMHKSNNVLNYLPKRSQPKVRKMLHDIWQAETRKDAVQAFPPPQGSLRHPRRLIESRRRC
jgi:hypothetical protein